MHIWKNKNLNTDPQVSSSLKKESLFSKTKKFVYTFKKEPTTVTPFHFGRKGRGLNYKNQNFIFHSDLGYEETAFFVFSFEQKIILLGFGLLLIIAFLINWHITLVVFFALITFLYFADLLFNGFLILRSFLKPSEIKSTPEEIQNLMVSSSGSTRALDGSGSAGPSSSRGSMSLPVYTVFCPLYKEWQVVPQFLEAMDALDWPKEKLQVMLLLEEDDTKTIDKVNELNLPSYVEVVVVPDSKPKTKPKAMNYGLTKARGEFLVIYDAEDKPEPDQLKKAYLALKKLPEEVICVQAKLNFYNPHQNLLTRLFSAEYSLWFDLVLTGLQTLNAPIPLGGTSNHFRTKDVKKMSGWDAFNVTEDADLGLRMAKRGYRTAIIESTTYEEANSNALNWYRQRSRWIKGYIMTYLVHMRRPGQLWHGVRKPHIISLQFIIGGKILSLFINPFMWLVTILYFAFRSQYGAFIESFFPAPVLYTGVVCLIFGNFLYLYYYMIGLAKRGYWDLIKYAFLVPLYWLGMSIAAWKGVWEVITKPHYWAKTVHGLHLAAESGGVIDEENIGWKKYKTLGSGGALIAAMLAANFLNFVFSAYLGRKVSYSEFGVVNAFNTMLGLFSVFAWGLNASINHRVTFLTNKYEASWASYFFKNSQKYFLLVGLMATVVWVALAPMVAGFFKMPADLVFYSFSPTFFLVLVLVAYRGLLQGWLKFGLVAVSVIAESSAKLIFGMVAVLVGKSNWVSASIPFSIAAGLSTVLISGLYLLGKTKTEKLPVEPFAKNFPKRFYLAVTATGISTAAFLSADVLLAKHYLSPDIAGQYSMVSLIGRMVFTIGTLLITFIVPIVSKEIALGKNPDRKFYLLLAGTAMLSLASGIALGPLGSFTLPILFGNKVLPVLPYINTYIFATILFSLAAFINSYHLVRKHYSFVIVSLSNTLALCVLLFLNHTTIWNFVNAELYISASYLILVSILHLVKKESYSIYSNLRDLKYLFKDIPVQASASGQRILVFNWRDTKHAFAGGAEIYIHELMKRWVKEGNSVTEFCGQDGKNTQQETIDGIQIIRHGGFYTVYFWAFVYYMLKFRKNFDVLVDCHNGIPFFTPLYAKPPIVTILHHVHQDVFYRYLPKPLAWFASVLENWLMPRVYSKVKFITVSQSSKSEMEKFGITGAGIEVVNPGIDSQNYQPGTKSEDPTILYLGRLKAYKSVDVLVKAFAIVAKKVDNAKLVIAGGGEEFLPLKKLAEDLGILDKIHFTGRISEEEKLNWYQKAWVFVNPSFMEGWGITTIEANACGVPVIASNVAGLRDSVKTPQTGFLLPHGDHHKFADKISHILEDHDKRNLMGRNAVSWAKNFDWEKSSDHALDIINRVIKLK